MKKYDFYKGWITLLCNMVFVLRKQYVTIIYSIMLVIWSIKKNSKLGHLGGSVGWASDFSSGHDFTFHEFEPRVGLCADSSEPGACFGFCVSLSLSAPSPLMLCLSVSQEWINVKKIKNK